MYKGFRRAIVGE